MHLMSGGNNVKHCDTSCKSAIKMPSLLFIPDPLILCALVIIAASGYFYNLFVFFYVILFPRLHNYIQGLLRLKCFSSLRLRSKE